MNEVEEPSLKFSWEDDAILDDEDAADEDASSVDTSSDDAPGEVAEGVAAASDEDASDGGTSGDDVPSKVGEGEAAFQKILDYNYSEEFKKTLAIWTRKRHYTPPPFPSPLTFQDRHLDPGIILKRVKLMPSMLHDLSANHGAEMEKFRAQGHSLVDGIRAPCYSGRALGNSRDVSRFYRRNLGDSCSAIASRCTLHPSISGSLLRMHQKPYKDDEDEDRYHTECSLEMLTSGVAKLAKSLDKDLALMLQNQVDGNPTLALWQIFSMSNTAEDMLKAIDTCSDPFPWELPRVTGHMPANFRGVRLHSDANDMSWSISSSSTESPSTEPSEAPSTILPDDGHLVSLPDPKSDEMKAPGANVNSFLQHAWARATCYDSTFIILTCGTLERICIRHRASQTLYVSELIDTSGYKDLTYGQIHLGLHLAIMQDALARMRQREGDRILKRKESEERSEDVKRQKVSPTEHQKKPNVADGKDVSEETNKAEPTVDCPKSIEEATSAVPEGKLDVSPDEEIDKKAGSRNLFLVHLNIGIHRSPAPASFIRIGKSSAPDIVSSSHGFDEIADGYSHKQYATIKLDKILGSGAVGVVYKGILELKDGVESGAVSKPIVVKLAFSAWQKRRMRKEYAVYSHLATKEGFEGVVRVHGFFQDAENGCLALVLNDAGMSLRQREFMRTGAWDSPLKTTAEERDAYARVLTSIHNAGVHHRDIRGFNLMINPDGKVFFIDFDRAKLNPSEWQQESEHSRLDCLLLGARETAGRSTGSSDYYSD